MRIIKINLSVCLTEKAEHRPLRLNAEGCHAAKQGLFDVELSELCGIVLAVPTDLKLMKMMILKKGS